MVEIKANPLSVILLNVVAPFFTFASNLHQDIIKKARKQTLSVA
jgi:hypothetical protein